MFKIKTKRNIDQMSTNKFCKDNILFPIRIQIFLDDLKEPFYEIQKTNILENKFRNLIGEI